MRAAVYYGNTDLRVEDVPEPTPGPGQVKLKVHRNGICGSDLHEYYDGPIFTSAEPNALTGKGRPVVMGHEFCGTITDLGAGVTGYAVGDRVTIEPLYRCGKCRACLKGDYNMCKQLAFHGLNADGGLAEYTAVPVDQLHKLPDAVSLDIGALVEPMAVAYHAAVMGQVNPESTALIYGAGPIGIGLWFALRGMGLTQIEVVEPSPIRRGIIERLGAVTLDPTTVDVPALIADRTNGDGVDAAFDAAGVAASVASALECVGERRVMVAVAIYSHPLETPLLNLVMRERRIQGTLCYTGADFRAVMDLMADGHYDTTGWVESIALSDVIQGGFEELRAGRRGKLLVDPTR